MRRLNLARREQYVTVATRLLDEGGPAAVTLREVARAAGVSHNAPYRHFESKTDLLAAIAARELRRGQAPRPDAKNPGLESMVRDYLRWATRYPERFKLTFGRWGDDHPELAEAAIEARRRFERAVQIEQEQRRMPPGDVGRLTSLILSVAHGAADLALAGHMDRTGKGRANPEDLVHDLFEHLAASAREGS